MKIDLSCNGKKRFAQAALLSFFLSIQTAFSEGPAWWSANDTRIINENAQVDNYVVFNLGQLKHTAQQAMEYLDQELSAEGGAGPEIHNMVNGFNRDPDINKNVVNLGQLKAVAKPFYDRLVEVGYDTKANLIARGYPSNWPYDTPWDPNLPTDYNYALANLGQLKMLFSFSVN